MDDGQFKKNGIDVKNRVMDEIRSKKICMESHRSLLAKKLGLECAMVASLLAGAFIASLVFYVFKKTKVLKFLSLGFPGLKVFLLTLPYGYIAFLIGLLIVILYIFNKLDLSYETRIPAASLYLLIFVAGVFLVWMFIAADIHKYFSEIFPERLPRGNAISGKVEEFSEDDLTIVEEDGQIVRVRPNKDFYFNKKSENIKGKYLRAVGERNPKDGNYFQAENILCCDDE